MQLPEIISIYVKCGKIPVQEVIVKITVKSGRKNPYHIFSPKTDQEGKAIITKEDFVGQFKDHWEVGLMDYDGTIESADKNVIVSLYDPTWNINNKESSLAWPLLKNEIPRWESREQKYNYFVSSHNQKYTAKSQKVDLNSNSSIQLAVRKNEPET